MTIGFSSVEVIGNFDRVSFSGIVKLQSLLEMALERAGGGKFDI